jgi:hypothetical protein
MLKAELVQALNDSDKWFNLLNKSTSVLFLLL